MFNRIQRIKKEMEKFSFKPALALLVFAAVLLTSAHAQSGNSTDKSVSIKMKQNGAEPTAKSRGTKIKFMPGSEETPQQRRQRLKRECKGRVNAGACEGYTR